MSSNFFHRIEIEDTFNKRPYEVIHEHLPTINNYLLEVGVYVYTVFISHKYINIRVREPPPNKDRLIFNVSKANNFNRVTKIYFINNKSNDVLGGEGFKVFYNPSEYIQKYFSFEWNKKVGLFIKRINNQQDYFLSNNQDLSEVLSKNYRRIWSV